MSIFNEFFKKEKPVFTGITRGIGGFGFGGGAAAGGDPLTASGGTKFTFGGYTYHVFTGPGTWAVDSGTGDVEYVVIGGGGAGGNRETPFASTGGGGAGGFRTSFSTAPTTGGGAALEDALSVDPTTSYPVVVGDGGASQTGGQHPGSPGNGSQFGPVSCSGGGGGGGEPSPPGGGENGGSGGGSRYANTLNPANENTGDTLANAYDLVVNGNEIGGGSIRIHDEKLQEQVFSILGFSKEEARNQFGFLMNAFKYGAPPHGGIAFGFDRLVAVMNNDESIRDYIAFPKNNSGKDVMIDSPSSIDKSQLDELNIKLK